MKPNDFIDMAQMIPYVEGKGELSGADCWGIVELYYKYVLGITLTNRGDINAGHKGLQAGHDMATCFPAIREPENHCLVIMKAKGFNAGHVGVYYEGHVLHSSDAKTGCVYQPITDRFIRSKITSYLRYS